MKPRVMIVEDEQALNLLLRYNLESEGFDVDVVDRGDEAETRVSEAMPDLVILDWMLPGVSGIEICRRLRARSETKHLPILMLTARGEESERVRGLDTGADDYVVKPFSLPELLARVHALLRRSNPEQTMKVLAAGDIELDRERKRVHRGGRELHLGPTEFRLLEFLMVSPASSRASNCSIRSGAGRPISTSGLWTSMSDACARRSRVAAKPIPSVPCAVPDIPSTSSSRKRASVQRACCCRCRLRSAAG
jgi:two-component system phosphate regulon response regulator PhoB